VWVSRCDGGAAGCAASLPGQEAGKVEACPANGVEANGVEAGRAEGGPTGGHWQSLAAAGQRRAGQQAMLAVCGVCAAHSLLGMLMGDWDMPEQDQEHFLSPSGQSRPAWTWL